MTKNRDKQETGVATRTQRQMEERRSISRPNTVIIGQWLDYKNDIRTFCYCVIFFAFKIHFVNVTKKMGFNKN